MDRSPREPGRQLARTPLAPVTVLELVALHVLDADLAALLWILLDAHLPLLVAFPTELQAPPEAPRAILAALLDLLPPDVRRLDLDGAEETFDWLGDAAALGWEPAREAADQPPGSQAGSDGAAGAARLALPPRRWAPPEMTYLVAGEIGAGPPADMWGSRARVLVRSLQRGYGLGATVRADSLRQALVSLAAPPASVAVDELRRLGVVLVVREMDPGSDSGAGAPFAGGPLAGGLPERLAGLARWRVAGAHFLRPLERDASGHLQRRPPAVLATWHGRRDAFEHDAADLSAEMALRTGMAVESFEFEQSSRSRRIAALTASGLVSVEALQGMLLRGPQPGPGRAG
ncbi:MAG: hypothetical protein ACP5VP_08030 [Candidatus Limnocylindrales bacterium]